jgi:carboxylesterase type B
LQGGGLQYSAAPNNDFSDWVSQSQDFIAVNVGYRLGALGFMAHESLPSANAGLLDQRLALKWVKDNIGAFGGNPDDVTIMGQSGGGYAVVSQMALYDGDSDGLFKKAIPRSIQRSPMFQVSELADRNAKFASLLNCTSGQDQMDCFQKASVPALVNAYANITRYTATSGYVFDPRLLYSLRSKPLTPHSYRSFQNLTFGSSAAFVPTIDDVTLTDSITNLFKSGKIANVPTIAGYVNDEGGNAAARNTSELSPATNAMWNLTDARVAQAASYYPVNETFGFASPDNFFLSTFKAFVQSLHPFGEGGITGSERLVGRYMSEAFGSDNIWTFRFNAPTVGTNYSTSEYPLAYVAHSADNSYLQNATSVMTPFEQAIAAEWRAYVGSFIRTGDPNKQKLASSPMWHNYGFLGDFVNSPIRLVSQFGYASNANSSEGTSTQIEVSQKAQLEREDWWTSDEVLKGIRL